MPAIVSYDPAAAALCIVLNGSSDVSEPGSVAQLLDAEGQTALCHLHHQTCRLADLTDPEGGRGIAMEPVELGGNVNVDDVSGF